MQKCTLSPRCMCLELLTPWVHRRPLATRPLMLSHACLGLRTATHLRWVGKKGAGEEVIGGGLLFLDGDEGDLRGSGGGGEGGEGTSHHQ
jgi:hypothetical protein